MRCPNYRLFCPNGLHLSHGEFCERCLGGREYWCVLRNCERNRLKSLGYALRNASARLTRGILDNVRIFIVLSKFQKQRYISGGIEPERIEILPNMIPALSSHAGEGLGECVAFVGRASPEKGIEDFLAAARLAPDLPFVVAGATERMPHLVAQSPQNVKWLGFLKGKELDDLYLQSRMVVMPSRCFEGFPNAVTHAMIAGKPVVATRLGGMSEIVEDGVTGYLFEKGNVTELAEKLRALYQSPGLCQKMGQAGREKALAQYSPEVVYKRLMEIFSKAVGA
jgi:glycosyltransferase involved in cell wall biosynthesis